MSPEKTCLVPPDKTCLVSPDKAVATLEPWDPGTLGSSRAGAYRGALEGALGGPYMATAPPWTPLESQRREYKLGGTRKEDLL